MGGRKKKFRASAATSDVVSATARCDHAATNNTTSRYESAATVASVTWNHRKYAAVIRAMAAMAATVWRASARERFTWCRNVRLDSEKHAFPLRSLKSDGPTP